MENEINSVGLSENILDKSSNSNLNPIKLCRKSLDDFIDTHPKAGKIMKYYVPYRLVKAAALGGGYLLWRYYL